MDPLEIIINIFIFINLYWYFLIAAFIPGCYYILIKIIAFPLAPNKAHEFIIIAKPEKADIKKVSNRFYPFFNFKKGLYWFSTPCQDLDNANTYHIYIEGLNQDVCNMERRDNKLGDLMQTKLVSKQISNHQIKLLKHFKTHLHRHWSITLEPNLKIAKLTPMTTPQPFRLSLYHTLGIYMQHEQEVEKEIENSSGNTILSAITTESVIQQLTYIQSYSYFSAHSAQQLYKKIKKIDLNFMTWVKGSIDPKLLMMLAILGMGVALVFLVSIMMKPDLGPMPTN